MREALWMSAFRLYGWKYVRVHIQTPPTGVQAYSAGQYVIICFISVFMARILTCTTALANQLVIIINGQIPESMKNIIYICMSIYFY